MCCGWRSLSLYVVGGGPFAVILILNLWVAVPTPFILWVAVPSPLFLILDLVGGGPYAIYTLSSWVAVPSPYYLNSVWQVFRMPHPPHPGIPKPASETIWFRMSLYLSLLACPRCGTHRVEDWPGFVLERLGHHPTPTSQSLCSPTLLRRGARIPAD